MRAILATLLFAVGLSAQPMPSTDRKVIWIRPVNTNNVAGYQIEWGTNRTTIYGATNTSTVIPLAPGFQTLIVRSVSAEGLLAHAEHTTAHVLKLTLQSAGYGIGPWQDETNWTWVISPASGNKLFRTKMDWSTR